MAGKPDRDWEHWPTRRPPDDRRRFGLKALFSPTDQPRAVEDLIGERSRELEERTEELHATIADLERREEQALRLRTAVEEMLRHGSAELDDRHAELTALAADLARREQHLESSERELAERRRELGAVELLRAAVERREAGVAEREATLERIAADLAERERSLADMERRIAQLVAREQELDARAAELESDDVRLQALRSETEAARRALTTAEAAMAQRETRVGDLELMRRRLEGEAEALARRSAQVLAEQAALESGRGELARAVAAVSSGLGLGPAGSAGPDPGTSHLLFVPGGRYRLEEAEGPAPGVADEVVIDERRYRVFRVGSSPLPGDRRLCAYVEPVASSGG